MQSDSAARAREVGTIDAARAILEVAAVGLDTEVARQTQIDAALGVADALRTALVQPL